MSVTDSLAPAGPVEEPTTWKLPPPVSYATNRSMSSPGCVDTSGSVNVARDAWFPMTMFCTFALAVDGSASDGSSC